MLIKDHAICIRATDFSETSQIVTFFTRENGKISVIAKGAKRPKSAFDGPIEVFAHGRIVFSDSNKEKLATLTEFQQQPGFANLNQNLFVLHCCLFAMELLNSMTGDYDPHPQLFDSFLQFLQNTNKVQVPPLSKRRETADEHQASLVRRLVRRSESKVGSFSEGGSIEHNRHSERSAAESRNLSLTDTSAALGVTVRTSNERRDTISLLILFQLSLLKEVGLIPVFDSCVNCKTQYAIRGTQYEAYFSSSANGLICRDCEASFPDKIRLTKKAADCLGNLELLADADEKTLNEIERVLIHHFTEILHHPPKMAKHILLQ